MTCFLADNFIPQLFSAFVLLILLFIVRTNPELSLPVNESILMFSESVLFHITNYICSFSS
jgi:hypothetical protein